MAKVALPRLHKAVRFAMKAHKKQDRDGESPLPYTSHPMDVLNILRYEGAVVDEDVLCAATLHDVLEETETTEADLLRRFGERVLNIVKELTREESDRTGLSVDEIWQVRTRTMLEEIGAMSPEARAIKLADRASNLRAALVTKKGEDLYRYVRQSQLILEKIPSAVSPAIWAHVKELSGSVVLPKAFASLNVAKPAAKVPQKRKPVEARPRPAARKAPR